MFVFSLKAEVGGYWFCYLNGGKVFFLQTVEEEEGGRRRRVSCDLLTPWLRDMWIEVTRFLSYSSLSHTHTLHHPLTFCTVHQFPVRWVRQGKIHLQTNTHTHTFTFQPGEPTPTTSHIHPLLPPPACTSLSPSSKTGLHPVKTNIKQIINHT